MIKGFRIVLILIPLLALNACVGSHPEPDWLGVQDFLYQLQRARPDRIGDTAFDLVVVSLSATGNSPECNSGTQGVLLVAPKSCSAI